MPRKNKKNEVKSTIDKKKGLMNTMVKDVVLVENEDIILQLPISSNDINKIIFSLSNKKIKPDYERKTG